MSKTPSFRTNAGHWPSHSQTIGGNDNVRQTDPQAFSSHGGDQDKTVRVWDVQTGKLIRTLEEHKDAVQAVVFSPDGITLATGSADMTVRLWNPKHFANPK